MVVQVHAAPEVVRLRVEVAELGQVDAVADPGAVVRPGDPIGLGVDPTWALVISQVVLSVGIPFAVIPLVWFTSRRVTMGTFANRTPLRIAGAVTVVAIVALNGALIVLTAIGAV